MVARGSISMSNNGLAILGLAADGSKVAQFWGNLNEHRNLAKAQGLRSACPDFGTEVCLTCDLGEDRILFPCDFDCYQCEFDEVCPCSRFSWALRQAQDGGDE
jgi:hypothetical protein